MVQEIKIRCKNNKKTLQLPIGSTLWDAYHALNLQMPYGPVSAKVNNKVEGEITGQQSRNERQRK